MNRRKFLTGTAAGAAGIATFGIAGGAQAPATGSVVGPPSGSASPAADAGQAKAPQKFLSPALADGINDVATFGSSAEEVSIYTLKGHLVFQGSQRGGAPIVWDCKDASGRVRESGVYIASRTGRRWRGEAQPQMPSICRKVSSSRRDMMRAKRR